MPQGVSSAQDVWRVVGYDGTEEIFEQELPAGCLSEREMIALLKRLASRDLDMDEVIGASLRRNAKVAGGSRRIPWQA